MPLFAKAFSSKFIHTTLGVDLSEMTSSNKLEFGRNFLEQHAGHIIKDPRHAIVELVSNAWDAGATEVHIFWPEQPNGFIGIWDNGLGMKKNEFLQRWRTLSYDRTTNQGREVIFPPHYKGNRKRKAYGQHGVGRHGMLCFAPDYIVETVHGGKITVGKVERQQGDAPFEVTTLLNTATTLKNGTLIWGINQELPSITSAEVINLIGSKFLYNPEFEVYVNGKKIDFADLGAEKPTFLIKTPEGTIECRRLDARSGRTIDHSGVAWWVEGHLVGEADWTVGVEQIIDGRHSIAKRIRYVLSADFMHPHVKADWSGFLQKESVNQIEDIVISRLKDDIHLLDMKLSRAKKSAAFKKNYEQLRALPRTSREVVAKYVEEIQRESPSLSEADLGNIVKVLAKMEMASTGYSLVEKLTTFSSEEIDELDSMLDEWRVGDARVVLNEIGKRLRLIQKLQEKVNDPATDELHQLQPLFARSLWIFGPRFESLNFTSNRRLTTVIEDLFARNGGDKRKLTTPLKRPDFVLMEDFSISVHSSDGYGKDNEVNSIEHILLVELKRGGFKVSQEESQQGQHYVQEIRRAASLRADTKIDCYVLGSSLDPYVEEIQMGASASIIPMTYDVVLNKAHQRLFNLQQKLEDKYKLENDAEMDEIFEGQLDFSNQNSQTA